MTTIRITTTEGTDITVSCAELVRRVAGKRTVYRGNLETSQVFVKIFVNRSSKRRHFEAELNGLQALTRANIPAPEVLYTGQTDEDYPAIVSRAITNGISVEVAWKQQIDENGRQTLIKQLLKVLALHHEAGLQHKDPHLKNFFVTSNAIYTLDGADISTGKTPLNKPASLQNLGLVLAQFQPSDDRRALNLLPSYCDARGWPMTPTLLQKIHETILQKREWRKKRYLKKIYRECSQVVSLSESSSSQLMERAFDTPAMRDFLQQPDRFAGSGTAECVMLKDGNSSTVVQLQMSGDSFVVKRYNIKGSLHRLKRMFSRSRAERCWENAHLLGFYGIPTAEPVAIRVDKTGPFRGRSWFIAQHLPGQTLMQFILDNRDNEKALADIVVEVTNIIEGLQEQQIAHGDFKANNFQISQGKVYLIDLDSMEQHRDAASFEKAQQKDLTRFLQNWASMSEVKELFLRALNGKDT